MGDPSGIGPEVTAKALAQPKVRRALVPVVFADESFAARGFDRVDAEKLTRVERPTVAVVTTLRAQDRKPAKPTRAGGLAQYAYVQAAISAAKRGVVDGICTAPVSKEQISRAGVPFMGHTEVLAEAFGAEVMMLMDGPRVKVALATNHLAIKDVPAALKASKLFQQLQLLDRSFRAMLGRRPRLAVTGLNPHAGEGGLLGREESVAIAPAIARARKAGIDANGPFPADGLFARLRKFPYDAALVMYHDQGLILAKALDFDLTVNVTLGLPLPRTSPDHGVAYDIAGKGRASAAPMVAALLKAAQLTGR